LFVVFWALSDCYLIIIRNNYERFILRCKMTYQTQRRRSLHIGKTHDQHLEACCRGIATNTSMVLNCALVTYIMIYWWYTWRGVFLFSSAHKLWRIGKIRNGRRCIYAVYTAGLYGEGVHLLSCEIYWCYIVSPV